MKLNELIEHLEDLASELEGTNNPNPEVHLAVQPTYPMRWGIANVRHVQSDDRIYLASSSGNDYIESGATAWEEDEGFECECTAVHNPDHLVCDNCGGNITH
tara:strand:+ start:1187 stop:1492 length:306 start_codon:yes stop_codon:yes gene_type:complete